MSLFSRVIFLTACYWCQFSTAACLQPGPHQQIVISQVNGNIAVEDKANSENCVVSNNLLDDEHQGSQVLWIFKGLDCARGDCVIELIGAPAPDERILKCNIGSPNNSQCKLKVNKLKRLCDTADDSNSEQCTIQYMIKVRGSEIDPSIIIKPRPTTE